MNLVFCFFPLSSLTTTDMCLYYNWVVTNDRVGHQLNSHVFHLAMPRKQKKKAVQASAEPKAECCNLSGCLDEDPIAAAQKKLDGMNSYRESVMKVNFWRRVWNLIVSTNKIRNREIVWTFRADLNRNIYVFLFYFMTKERETDWERAEIRLLWRRLSQLQLRHKERSGWLGNKSESNHARSKRESCATGRINWSIRCG